VSRIDALLRPDWPAPSTVQAVMTTRAFGDMARSAPGRAKLHDIVPAEPVWLRQVHGTHVIDADTARGEPEADAAVARRRGIVCAVLIADCMPVIITNEAGTAVGVVHAGWRGLSGGVIEATVRVLGSTKLMAWLGPAIGPRVYEVGEEVRSAFLPEEESAFLATRPGHWLLDLYAVARRRLAASGVSRVYGGGFCTYSEAERFFSYRRERGTGRMAALVWLT
jgi:YfiH family protein